jgi:cytidylate kinase
MVGRDIGTVVLPDADLKIYLDASAEERAKRRFEEMTARGANVDYEDILAKVLERDRLDTTRDVAPLKAADDAVVIDSNKLDVDEVLEKVLGLCR